MAERLSCRLCGSQSCESVGEPVYRTPPQVAGVRIRVDDVRSELIRCGSCGYFFTYPPVPQERLDECYREADLHWETGGSMAERRFYKHKQNLLLQYGPPQGKLLNVGCFDGGFEKELSEDFDCYGIEPSETAASIAAERGVSMLGVSLSDLAKYHDLRFDYIVLFDVAEHLIDPVSDFSILNKVLNPGGVIMFETGDMDAFPWQSEMRLNPYVALYEHVGFFNATSVKKLAQIIGLELIHLQRSVHTKVASMERIKRYVKLQAFWLLRVTNLTGFPLTSRLRKVANGPVPVPPVSNDHLLAVLKKEG